MAASEQYGSRSDETYIWPIKVKKMKRKIAPPIPCGIEGATFQYHYINNTKEQIIGTQDKPQCLVATKATLTLTVPGWNKVVYNGFIASAI